MIRFLADENLNGAVTRALVRRGLDIHRVQDVGLRGESDVRVLDWAASAGRVVVTHDRATLIGLAYERIRASGPLSGVIVIAQSLGVRAAADDLELIALCSEPEEWARQVRYLPLK